jgi:hypothetical protein
MVGLANLLKQPVQIQTLALQWQWQWQREKKSVISNNQRLIHNSRGKETNTAFTFLAPSCRPQ